MTTYNFADGLKRGASKSLKRSQREIRRIGKGLGLVIRKQRSGDGLRNDHWEMMRNLINGCVERRIKLAPGEITNLLNRDLLVPSSPVVRLPVKMVVRKLPAGSTSFKGKYGKAGTLHLLATPKVLPTEGRLTRR